MRTPERARTNLNQITYEKTNFTFAPKITLFAYCCIGDTIQDV
jgi:hypothetical protein